MSNSKSGVALMMNALHYTEEPEYRGWKATGTAVNRVVAHVSNTSMETKGV